MFGDVIAGRNLRFTARQLIPLPCRPQIDLLILDRFWRIVGFYFGHPLTTTSGNFDRTVWR